MVRWRCCLFLTLLLVLPVRAGSKNVDDDEEESRADDPEEEDDDEDDDDDEPAAEKLEHAVRRLPAVPLPTSSTSESTQVTRTEPRRPLECFVCAYKAETKMRSCLDPTKYRVHTMICHSLDDQCFTSVIPKGSSYDAVMRGCRSGCIGTSDTTCCDINRCNNQALALPVAVNVQPRHGLTAISKSKSNTSRPVPPSVLFFVTILLLLQTVGKVAFV